MSHTFNSLFSLCLKVACGLGSIYFIYTQYWVGLCVIIPVFFIDMFLNRFKADSMASILKVFVIFQGALIWYLASNEFFHKSVSSTYGALKTEMLNRGMHGASKPLNIEEAGGPALSSGAQAKKQIKEARKAVQSASNLYPVKLSFPEKNIVNQASTNLISSVIGDLFQSDFPDLKYRTSEEVRQAHPRVFEELPQSFSSDYKNPCWLHDLNKARASAVVKTEHGDKGLACLPYAYLLGQPKCGTSDLFERMKKHDKIRMPNRKEVRWFTRGEFTTGAMSHEGDENLDGTMEGRRQEQLLGVSSSIYSFTSSFGDLTSEIGSKRKFADELKQTLITVDGGPHTFWWPTQSPDGSYLPNDIPPAQLLREIQPNAKFIITLSDPVKRMYSDYHFLDDNLKPVRPGEENSKSAQQFHDRSTLQVEQFNACIAQYESDMNSNNADIASVSEGKGRKIGSLETNNLPVWFRAAQMCAHNRHAFGKGGWGRLSIGLYSLYFEKWLEQFPPEQFLVVRLEDYSADPKGHMKKIFDFLEVGEPSDWEEILNDMVYNEHFMAREPLFVETEQLLREFYQPYNDLLAQFLDNNDFKWDVVKNKKGEVTTLHDIQVEDAKKPRKNPPMMMGRDPRQRPGGPPGGPGGDPRQKGLGPIFDPEDMEGGGFDPRMGPPPGFEFDPDHPPPPGFDPRMMHDPRSFDHGHGQFGRGGGGGMEDRGYPRGDPRHDKHHSSDSKGLRGHPDDMFRGGSRDPNYVPKLIDLFPMNFSIEGLPFPEGAKISTFFEEDDIDFTDGKAAATQLCISSFGLDIAALKLMLYEKGVPATLVGEENMKRNAFHCLAMIYSMIDPHPKSQMFAHLKGKESWLTPLMNPQLELKLASISSRDVMNSIETAIGDTAKWLARAGVPIDAKDVTSHTPLHIAAMGGILSLAKVLLEAGADPNAIDHEKRTPLHYAAAMGHAELAGLLLQYKADKTIMDKFDMTPEDVFTNPGPISAEDAQKYLNIEQRAVRTIDRIIHPELSLNDTEFGWSAGDGGWSTKRLEGFEEDMSCDVDQYWADEITGDEIFTKYLARNSPVLIRGLLDEWDAAFEYEHDILRADHGKLKVSVSDIPYSDKFGGTDSVDMKLSEYIDEMAEHRVVGGHHPWYVFRAHQIPQNSESKDSLVKFNLCPTPEALEEAFEQMPPNPQGVSGKKARTMFVNAQWALGCEGTGAPVHFHNTAWNALIYGAKKWFIYPPHNMIMSNKQIFDYYETDMQDYLNKGVKPQTCVQTAGDLMIIPESWGHGVLNLQDSVAVASESKQALFRLAPNMALFTRFPSFD